MAQRYPQATAQSSLPSMPPCKRVKGKRQARAYVCVSSCVLWRALLANAASHLPAICSPQEKVSKDAAWFASVEASDGACLWRRDWFGDWALGAM
mgnify:CR=1 FL=1